MRTSIPDENGGAWGVFGPQTERNVSAHLLLLALFWISGFGSLTPT